MSAMNESDPIGRPGVVPAIGPIVVTLVASIAGSVWPPSGGSGTPPFDNRRQAN